MYNNTQVKQYDNRFNSTNCIVNLNIFIGIVLKNYTF